MDTRTAGQRRTGAYLVEERVEDRLTERVKVERLTFDQRRWAEQWTRTRALVLSREHGFKVRGSMRRGFEARKGSEVRTLANFRVA